METYDKLWVGKRVFVKVKGFVNRSYSGVVLNEDYTSITIRDIKNNIVRLSFDEISLLQEEFERK